MKKSNFVPAILVLVAAMLAVAGFMACGNGSTGSANTTGTVTTFLSDPPTCKDPHGAIQQVWVTITKVRAHVSGNADPNDGGWVDLVNLESMPRQIDLLDLDSTACLLTQLGSTSGLQPGNYQQIRVHLLPTDASPGPTENACTDNDGVVGNNCVVSNDTAIPLLLSSQDETGIKIPPGQIAGGGIVLEAGQAADIDIHFNACSSIVLQGNNGYRLRPTLHAGEISLDSNVISGRVVGGEADAGAVVATNPVTPISGAIVLLEQPESSNGTTIDRMKWSAVTGSDGRFTFCPVPDGDGPYDVVIAASDGTTTYNATVTFSVPGGTDLGDIPLLPDESTTPPSIEGEVTSNPSDTDVFVSPLQEATLIGATINVTIPVFGATSQPPLLTTSGGTLMYSLSVPASNPVVGTYDSASLPTAYAEQVGITGVPYNVNAKADICSPPSVTTASTVDVTGTPPITAATIDLVNCSE